MNIHTYIPTPQHTSRIMKEKEGMDLRGYRRRPGRDLKDGKKRCNYILIFRNGKMI